MVCDKLRKLFKLSCRDNKVIITSKCCRGRQTITINVDDFDTELLKNGNVMIHLSHGELKGIEEEK